MKFKKIGCRIFVVFFSLLVLLFVFSIVRIIMKWNSIPFLSDYGLDFSTNSGTETLEKLGTPDFTIEIEEEEKTYYTYYKPAFGKDAKVELVTNMLTDYFFRVYVTWQFDSEQDAIEWYEDVKLEICKEYYVPFVFQEEAHNPTRWECSFGGLIYHVDIDETEVIFSAVDAR